MTTKKTGGKKAAPTAKRPRPAPAAAFECCPCCGGGLKKTCPACGKPIQNDWRVCPYCGASVDPSSIRQA